jgi:Transposase zinc-binding domain/Putative transposase
MRAVSVCRTQELGGHLKQCDTCGFEHPTYNSCRNRHCPKCQSLAKAKWLEKQTSELLPVGYFHLVFALPHEFNRLILAHKKIGLSLLFKAVSETLLEFGQTRLKGTLGIIAVLHTWDQTLKDHFHLHCLVPADALSSNHSRWIGARPNFLFPVTALSQVFQGKFLALLQQAVIKEKSRRPTTRSKHHAKRAGWSTPKNRSVLHRPCSITSPLYPPRGAVQRAHPFGPKRSGHPEL